MIGKVEVGITGDMSGLKKTLDDTSRSLSAFGDKAKNVGKNVSDVGSSMTKWITGPLLGAATAITALGVNVGNLANDLLTLESQTGISTDSLQEWAYAATQAGGNANAVQKAIFGLSRRMPELASETGEGAKALERLGLEFTDIANLEPEKVFELLLERLSTIPNVLERNAVASKVLGLGWKEVSPIIAEGAEGIAKLRLEAHDLGIVLDKEALVQADKFRRAWDSVKDQMGALKNEIGITFMPFLQNTLVPFIQTKVVPAIRSFAEAIQSIVTWFTELPPGGRRAIAIIGGVLVAIGPVVLIVGKLITLTGVLSGALAFLAANPVVAIIGGLVLLGTAFYALWNTVEGFRNFWTGLWDGIKTAAVTMINFVIDGINMLIETLNLIPWVNIPTMGRIEVGMAGDASAVFTEGFNSVVTAVSSGLDGMARSITADLSDVTTKLGDVETKIGGANEQLETILGESLTELGERIETSVWDNRDAISERMLELQDAVAGIVGNIDGATEAIGLAKDEVTRLEGELARSADERDALLAGAITELEEAHLTAAEIEVQMQRIQDEGIPLTEEERQMWVERLVAAMRVEAEAKEQVARLGGIGNILSELGIPIVAIPQSISATTRAIAALEAEMNRLYDEGAIVTQEHLDALDAQHTTLLDQLARLEAAEVLYQDIQAEIATANEHIEGLELQLDAANVTLDLTQKELDSRLKDVVGGLTKFEGKFLSGMVTVSGDLKDGFSKVAFEIGDPNGGLRLSLQDGVLDLMLKIGEFEISVTSAIAILQVLTSAQTAAMLAAVGAFLAAVLPPLIVIGVVILALMGILNAIKRIFTREKEGTPTTNIGEIMFPGLLPSFQWGGVVPGQIGEPRLIMAHGGEPVGRAGFEEVLNYEKLGNAVAAGLLDGLSEYNQGRGTGGDVILQVSGRELGRAALDGIMMEQQRRGVVIVPA